MAVLVTGARAPPPATWRWRCTLAKRWSSSSTTTRFTWRRRRGALVAQMATSSAASSASIGSTCIAHFAAKIVVPVGRRSPATTHTAKSSSRPP